MEYSKVIEYLYSFINYENLSNYSYEYSFKLIRMKSFLQAIGNPQRNLKVIHVAGSKGKGSVCLFIAYILKEAGFKVGLYTSPHLSDFRERIRLLDQRPKTKDQRPDTNFEGMISKQDICKLVTKLRPAIEMFNKNSRYRDLSFFEIYTALAYQYFKAKKVDFVVLETGLGGRLDSTNTCSSLLSIITPISYEHTIRLGRSLQKIALEKASIIKKENKQICDGKIIALSSRQDKRVIDVIEKTAKENKGILLIENRDFRISARGNNLFDYTGRVHKFKDLKINLLGRHQISNAGLAVASIEALRYHNVNIGKQAIRKGLKHCFWPARFEIISRNPLIIIDGAQNAASVIALRKTLKENFPKRKTQVIFGISKDKEIKDTCKQIAKISRNIILTKSDNPRASEPKDLARYFRLNSVLLTKTVEEALDLAKAKIEKRSDLILVTGSLFLCGQIRKMIFR